MSILLQLPLHLQYQINRTLVVVGALVVFISYCLLLLNYQLVYPRLDVFVIIFVQHLIVLLLFLLLTLRQSYLGSLCANKGQGIESDLTEEVFLRIMRFMEQQPQIQTIDIYHNRFLLTVTTSFLSIELQIPVFIKPLLLVTSGHVVEQIDLR